MGRRADATSGNNQNEPLLLLEGDRLFVSGGGVARTVYELAPSPGRPFSPKFAIEERYDLERARKTFVLRRGADPACRNGTKNTREYLNRSTYSSGCTNSTTEDLDEISPPMLSLGPEITTVELQEIDRGFDVAGTGCTTWESSIAMALRLLGTGCFVEDEEVRGRVLEIGSGLGLGGIFISRLGWAATDEIHLTDGNDEVLKALRQNVRRNNARGMTSTGLSIRVSKLDWNEICSENLSLTEQYDTILACDCAYRLRDVVPLGNALNSLLRRDTASRIHLFGPGERAAFQELVKVRENAIQSFGQLESPLLTLYPNVFISTYRTS